MLGDIVLIVPMHNEQNRWSEEFWRELISYPGIHLIFVDDGSNDGTRDVLVRFCENQINANVLITTINLGKAEAVRYGITHLLSLDHFEEVLSYGYLDGDCAISAREVYRIADLSADLFQNNINKEGSKVISVWASRVALSGRVILRSKLRHYISRILISIIGLFHPKIPYDSQCGFKLFSNTSVVNSVFNDQFKTKWFFDLEIHKRMMDLNVSPSSIREEPLEDWKEIGNSHITIKTYPFLISEIYRILRVLKKKREHE